MSSLSGLRQMRDVVAGMRRLATAWRLLPTATSVFMAAIPLGLVVLVLGEGASRALTVIGGDLPARALGVLFFGGGMCSLVSVLIRDSFVEAIGSGLIAGGMAIYSAAAFIGLGTQGLIAGILSLSMAVGFMGRVFLLTSVAHRLDNPP